MLLSVLSSATARQLRCVGHGSSHVPSAGQMLMVRSGAATGSGCPERPPEPVAALTARCPSL